MSVASWKRWRVVALGLALAVAGVLTVASGVVAWRRARLPSSTVRIPVTQSTLFCAGGRAIITSPGTSSVEGEPSDDVWSLEDGQLLCTVSDLDLWDPGQGGLLIRGAGGSLEMLDPITGATERIVEAGVVPQNCRNVDVSPGLDLVAFVSSGAVEVRSIRGARAPCSLSLVAARPCAWIGFSPGGDRLGVMIPDDDGKNGGDQVTVWSLSDPRRPQLVPGNFAGFSAGGDVLTLVRPGPGPVELRGTKADGATRLLANSPGWQFSTARAVDRLATLEPNEAGVPGTVLVRTFDGALVRSVPVRSPVKAFHLTPAGDRLAIVYKEGLVEVWELPPP